MKRLWQLVGAVVFWITWPALRLYVARRPTTRVLLTNNKEFLAVKGWLSEGKWHLPGGGIKRGESAEDAIIRELAEETGVLISASQLVSFGKHTFCDAGIYYTADCYYAELPSVPAVKAGREIIACKWLSLQGMHTQALSQDVVVSVASWRDSKNLVH